MARQVQELCDADRIGANSPTELAGRPIRYIFGDEIDRWPESAGAEGDPLKLIEKRATTFRNRRIVYVSTPTTKKNKINQQYLLGTQEEWQVKCPECGRLHMIRFEDIRYKYDAREVNGRKQYHGYDVFWKCHDCLGEFGETVMKAAPAEWVAHNAPALEQSKCRSFHLNAFTSHWIDWRAIITEYLEAEKDVNLLRVFYNTTLGEPWDIMDVDDLPDELLARREHYTAEIPNGCLVLTMGVDTQDNRLQYEVVGWGEDEESWGIQYRMIRKQAAANSQCLTIDELLTPRAQPSCVGCICNICLLWWSGRCPYGNCHDDARARTNPYDAAHPGKIRKSWSNWAAPGEQSHWCRGGILYHAYTCEHYKHLR